MKEKHEFITSDIDNLNYEEPEMCGFVLDAIQDSYNYDYGYQEDFTEDCPRDCGHKEKQGKSRVDLVMPEMIEALADGFAYGADKYGEYDWVKGLDYLDLYAATMRHLLQWRKGVDLDEESGLHHIKHAMCNLGMLITLIENGFCGLHDNRDI